MHKRTFIKTILCAAVLCVLDLPKKKYPKYGRIDIYNLPKGTRPSDWSVIDITTGNTPQPLTLNANETLAIYAADDIKGWVRGVVQPRRKIESGEEYITTMSMQGNFRIEYLGKTPLTT